MWKITGNGLKKPSYLYGTMHVSNRVAYNLSEQFFEALKSVETVGLETSPGDWMENMEKTGELGQLAEFRPNNYGDFYKSAFTVTFPEKKVFQSILSYDPDIIDGLLYRQNKSRENFEESTYIDLFIFQSASKLNKRLISLEDFAQSEIKAKLSAIPDENPANVNLNANYYSISQKIEDSYREGNLDMLDSLSKMSSSKNTQQYLIDDRNVFFVTTIDSVLKTSTLFSGVGAAHLPGEKGVIELLRKKGYQVEPVIPRVSKKSNTEREELDAKIKPVTFQKQFVEDSAFSVSLPGKLYPLINFENLRYYINADMVNGSFYTVVRLKHNGLFFNHSPEQMMAKVDSLLFENIPGKILQKKDIVSNNGLKGIELINRTRKGDEQHYQVYFSEIEMILFKLGGKDKYATGSEAKQFFNSINFISKPENVITFSPKTKGFQVKIPANYSYVKNNGSSMSGLVEDLFAYSRGKRYGVGLKQAVYNDFNYLEEDSFELNRFCKHILSNYNFTVAPVRELGTEQGFPRLRVHAKNNMGNHFYAKIFIKGVHYYFVYYISENESGFNNDFFASFKLIDFEHVNPIKEITDKDMCFKVKDEVTENALSRFNDAYARAYEASKSKKDSLKNDYEYRTANKLYYSPSTNEYVTIEFEKYNDYDYKNIDSLEKQLDENIKKTTGMLVTHKKVHKQKNYFTYKCLLKDTATVRAIETIIIVKNGLGYQVSVPVDTAIGLKGWAKGFMESFAPVDTALGKPIFTNKFNLLLKDLCSNDTVKRQAANNSLKLSLGMQNEYANDYLKFISEPKHTLASEESRAQLFVNGGTIHDERIITPYKNLYKQYTDSFYLQLCLLKGLSFLKTQNSYAAFNSLLLSEVPLVGSETTINDVFYGLHDSLELCKNFFPGMLSLTKYDEYRNAVYSLMADMVDRKILAPQSYVQQKETILTDANLALKRYTPGTPKLNSSSEYNLDYLDKNAKEIAESIKLSLEGLNNNNAYKGTAHAKRYDFYERTALVNYAFVLAPFYKSDEKVKQYFSKLAKLKAQNILMPVTINLLKQGVMLNDTIVTHYSRNKFTRAYFYSELEKEKLTDKFDKKYLRQDLLVESLLSGQRQLNSYYNYEKDKSKKDSLVLVKLLPAHNRYQKGTMYVYKLSRARNEEEQWAAVFVGAGKEAINSKMEVVIPAYYIDTKKTEKENLDELIDYFSVTYRKRAATPGNTYN